MNDVASIYIARKEHKMLFSMVYIYIKKKRVLVRKPKKERVIFMKKTVESIEKNLKFLEDSRIKALKVSVADLKEQFIDEQLKGFKIDLSNKVACVTITQWLIGGEFYKSLKKGVAKKVGKVDIDNNADTERSRFYSEVERIANATISGAYSPIMAHTKEMRKALTSNNLAAFNDHMQEMFAISLNEKQFSTLALMTISAKRTDLDIMSDNQFKNLIMHIFTRKAVQANNVSVKKCSNALGKALKDVVTCTYEEAESIMNGNYSTLTIDTLVKKMGIEYKKEEKDYAVLAKKVRRMLHTKIAVEPKVEEETK